MQDNTLSQEFSQATIQRSPHDGENPYVMVNRGLIRDESISPQCRWLIIYLLSNKDGWKIKVSQIAQHIKKFMGKNRVYDLFNEAIEAGYIKREVVMKGNLKQLVTYYVSENASFKKSFRHPGFRETDPRDTENRDDKERISNKKEHHKERIVSEPPSSVVGLTTFFIEKLKEINPMVRISNPTKWAKEIDCIIRNQKWSEEQLRDVINYIVLQHKNPKKEFTWSKAVASPEKLKKHFPTIWLEMNTKTDTQKQEDIKNQKAKIIQENHEWAKNLRQKVAAKLGANIYFTANDHSVGIGNRAKREESMIGYGENGFREIIEKYLRQSGVL